MRCVPWDWSQAHPPDLDWGGITHCIATEVVYYAEFKDNATALADTLAMVIDRCCGVEVLLLLRLRAEVGTCSNSMLEPSEIYEGSSVATFIEEVLPRSGLRAAKLPFEASSESKSARGLRLFRVMATQSSTLPQLAAPECRAALAQPLQTAWLFRRSIAGVDSKLPPDLDT